ncbi:MAG TPA: long-chain fatty acid--CoA ligase [Streptosporangiaceae bacterium]
MPDTREWTVPPRYIVPATANATDDIVEHAARGPERVAFSRRVGGEWRPVTARQFADQVARLAAGLIALGIRQGDRVGLMSGTRYEWMLCDFAIWTAGAVSVPIYETSSVEQVRWILRDSGAVAVFAENEGCATAVESARGPAVRHVWRIDGTAIDDLVLAGASVAPAEVERRRRAVTADSVATIAYTSGTTGRQKGCVLTHGNLVAETRNVALADEISERVLTEGASILLFLPLAHIFARIIQLCAVHKSVVIGHTSDLINLPATLAEFRPTVVLAVPRVFEKLYNAARGRAADQGHERLFQRAEAAAVAYSRVLDTGGPGLALRVRRRAFDLLVYRKLRAAMGGRVEWAVSGGAPLGERLGHFLRGAGIDILEGWGLTETTAGSTLNLPSAQRVGTVGRPLPGCTVRTADDGEVLVRGPHIFRGYWRDEAATREALADGWFRTGDVGMLTDDGFLRITGRKKDMIVTAAGKNVSPAVLEDRLRAHWLVGECVVVGDNRPYVGALITLDADVFDRWKKERRKPQDASIAELRDDADLRSAVQEAVDDANAAVSKAEAIKRFRVLPGEFAVGVDLTPTQKVRRQHVLMKFAADVAALYHRPQGQGH